MSNLALSIKLTTEGGQIVVKELTQIGQAAGTTNKELVNTGTAGSAAKKGLDEAGTGATQLNGYMNTLRATAGLVIGSLSAMQLIDTADEWGQMASRIRQATESSDEYNYVQQRMVDSANDTYRSITETREGFVMMSPILRDMNYNLGQSIDIVDSFSALLVTNAANAERGASSQAALTKSIQSGRIEADAWQTIFGVMPTILDNITSATGKTGAEIRQLGVTGKLSITDLTNALLLGHHQNMQAVEAMPTTVRDAIQSFSNVFSNYIGWQNEARGITADVADGIGYLADNFETLVNIIGGAAAGALTLYTARTAIATKATILSYREKQIAAAQELRLAQAQAIQTQATLAQVTAQATYATGSARVIAATTAHDAAVKRLTVAQAAHTTVARSLLGVLGGPVGLALMAGVAATSFLSFSSSATEAKDTLKDMQQPLDSIRESFKKLNDDQRSAQVLKWLDAEREAVKEANKEYGSLTKTIFGYQGAFEQLTPERFALNEELNKAVKSGEALTPVLQRAGEAAGVPQETINNWVTLAGKYADAKVKADQAAAAIKAVNDANAAPATLGATPNIPVAENKELTKALLDVYNAQLLNATAVDAYGASLNGINLELFKAEFVALTQLPDDAAAAIKRFADEAKTAAANLEINTYSTELSKQIALMDVRLAKGEKEYEIQKALAQFTGADPARLTALQAELAIMQQKQALQADQTTLETLTKENDLLMVRLAHGQQEYELQKALAQLKGQDPAVLAAIEAELRLRQQLTQQITISEEITSGAFNKALDEMSALSSAGATFGDVLTQAFGRVAQQIDGMSNAQINYNQQLTDLAKRKKAVQTLSESDPKRAKELLAIQQTEARLGKENFQAQMGQFSALSGAASQMFGEQSREREALHKMEMAFGVVEIAMSLQKAGANALTAITSAFSAPFPMNFAAGAAMIGIMAGLGVFSGGSSGSAPSAADNQASQGTGTVLGDDSAKSESIANSLSRIEDLELDQYSELRSINSSIKALNAGIANLAVSLVGNFGKFNEQGYSGQLGTEKQLQLGSGLSSFVSGGVIGLGLDKLLDGMLGGIFNSLLGGISKTTKKLVDSGIAFDSQQLGDIIATGLVDASYYNVIETTKRKLWGLSKKTSTSTEYSELDNALLGEFGRIFGFIGASVTDAVDVLGIDTARALENFAINLPNISFKDLSGDEIAAELEAVFSQQADLMTKYLVPSIAEYQQMGEGLYDTLIRVAQEQAVFNAQLDALGLELGNVSAALRIDVSQSIIELMGGIEAFRDATSEYFSSFYSDAEQFDYLSKTVSQALAGLGLSVPATREQFKAMVDALDLTTDAGQQLFAQLMQLVPGMDQYFSEMDNQTQEFEDATQRLADALAQQLAAINGVLDSIGKDILGLQRTLPGFDNVAYITGQIEQLTGALSGSDSLDEQLDITQQLRAAVMERYNAELAAMSETSRIANELNKAEQDAYKAELAAVQALNKAAETLQKTAAQMLIGDLSPLTTGQRLAEAQSQFDSALTDARGGDADAYALVQSLGQQILQLQKEFNPAAYTDVFGDVKAIFDELGGNMFAEPEAPPLHPDLVAYENEKIALAEQTIAELQRLQEQTAALRNVAQQEYTIQLQQIPVVNGAVVVNNDKVVAQIKELQAAQVAAAQQAAQQAAAQAAKQQQQLAALEQQQALIRRGLTDNHDMMQRLMRR